MKHCLYLFQVEQDLPPALEAAAGPDSDILFLSWGAKSADPRSIFYPSSSWTQGRNRLLREALGRDYRYFVFADDDIHLELTALGARNAGRHADPWRVFEEFLLEREPAIGCTSFHWHLTGGAFDPTQDCQTVRFFDALFNAFHHEALTSLLPYYDLLDEGSECYSQNLLCSLAADLYPGNVLQTNRVHVTNLAARRVEKEFVLSKPEHLYLDALREPERAHRFLRQTAGYAARHPTWGEPRPKGRSYRRTEADLARLYHLEHPLWLRHRELLELPITDEFFSDAPDTARALHWRAVRRARRVETPPSPQTWLRRLLIRTRPVRERIGLMRSNPALRWARRQRVIVQRARARRTWRRWFREAGSFLEMPGIPHQSLYEVIATALNDLPGTHCNFIDVGAGVGHVLDQLAGRSNLEKQLFSIGIDPIHVTAHMRYAGYVTGAITDGPEGSAEFFRYSSADCSSLRRMDATTVTHVPGEGGAQRYFTPGVVEDLEEVLSTPTFRLSTIVRQYGLEDDVLHFVKIDAQGSDLDVFRSLDSFVQNVLFLQIETVYGENGEGGPALYEGQTSFPEDRAVIEAAGFRLFNVDRFKVTPEADVIFVNTKLFQTLLPHLAR